MSYVVGCRERAHEVLMICLKFPPSIGFKGTWCWGTCLCVNTCLVIQDWQPMVSLFWKITSCFFCFVLLKILPLLPPSCTSHWDQCWWSPETQTESLERALLVPSHHTQVAEVLLMSSFWSHAESAQQQQKRNIHHDHLSLYSKSVPQPLNPHIFINISVPVDAGSKTVDKQMKYHWIRRTYPGKWHYDGNWWVLPLSGLQCKRMDNKLHHFFACSGSRWPIKWGTPQQCVCQHFHCEAWVVKAWYCTPE